MVEFGQKYNVLFVCSRNQWRSPTAEVLWRKHPAFNVRSAGTSAKARRKVSLNDIQWADKILVMENRHKSQLKKAYSTEMVNKEVHVLDIEDLYTYMDDELVEALQHTVPAILGLR